MLETFGNEVSPKEIEEANLYIHEIRENGYYSITTGIENYEEVTEDNLEKMSSTATNTSMCINIPKKNRGRSMSI
jgi:hypothetical protein